MDDATRAIMMDIQPMWHNFDPTEPNETAHSCGRRVRWRMGGSACSGSSQGKGQGQRKMGRPKHRRQGLVSCRSSKGATGRGLGIGDPRIPTTFRKIPHTQGERPQGSALWKAQGRGQGRTFLNILFVLGLGDEAVEPQDLCDLDLCAVEDFLETGVGQHTAGSPDDRRPMACQHESDVRS